MSLDAVEWPAAEREPLNPGWGLPGVLTAYCVARAVHLKMLLYILKCFRIIKVYCLMHPEYSRKTLNTFALWVNFPNLDFSVKRSSTGSPTSIVGRGHMMSEIAENKAESCGNWREFLSCLAAREDWCQPGLWWERLAAAEVGSWILAIILPVCIFSLQVMSQIIVGFLEREFSFSLA